MPPLHPIQPRVWHATTTRSHPPLDPAEILECLEAGVPASVSIADCTLTATLCGASPAGGAAVTLRAAAPDGDGRPRRQVWILDPLPESECYAGSDPAFPWDREAAAVLLANYATAGSLGPETYARLRSHRG